MLQGQRGAGAAGIALVTAAGLLPEKGRSVQVVQDRSHIGGRGECVSVHQDVDFASEGHCDWLLHLKARMRCQEAACFAKHDFARAVVRLGDLDAVEVAKGAIDQVGDQERAPRVPSTPVAAQVDDEMLVTLGGQTGETALEKALVVVHVPEARDAQ